jgi:hypothetical protein
LKARNRAAQRTHRQGALLPAWASAEAGSDGAMVLVNDQIDWMRRSERMRG